MRSTILQDLFFKMTIAAWIASDSAWTLYLGKFCF